MKLKQILSAFICASVMLGAAAAPAYADPDEVSSVTVTAAVQKDGEFIIVPQSITVKDGLAEEYGYTVSEKNHNDEPVDEPTFFDAMVQIHKEKYGAEFTKDTAKDYLDLGSSGYIIKAFGADSSASGFYINSEMPADSSGMGYTADTAELKPDDTAEFWFYQDTDFWSDCYTCFDTVQAEVQTDTAFELTVYKTVYDAAWNASLAPIDGTDTENNYITVNTVNSDGSVSAALEDSDGNEISPDENGKITLSFADAGIYIVTAQGFVNGGAPIVAPFCTVTVTEPEKPTSIEIRHDAQNVIDGKIIIKKGDTFKLTAYDQNGEETPVIWENTSYGGGGAELDEATGNVTIVSDIYNSTSYLYFKATSLLDETVTSQITVQASGYLLSEYQKTPSAVLSEDGQTAKTVSVTGGHNGHNIWSYDIPDNIAEPAADPGSGSTLKFNVFRPGTFDVTFKLDINEELTDTAAVTVTGVAVEAPGCVRGKTYLDVSAENPAPTVQLTAFTAGGRTVSAWESADETVAAVDENGLVTAKGIGSAIITAIDSEGTKGGIKVVVESEETPYFESLEFATSAFNSGVWVKDATFSPTKLEYDLPIKNYSTSSLALQATTLYDTEKYTAAAEYTDVNGIAQCITVNSGKITTLPNQPFGSSVMTITVSDRSNAEKKTVYTFNVSRPRDTTKAIKSSGITLSPAGRELSQTAYNNITEGTMQKADENGDLTSGTGVSSTAGFYRTFVYDDAQSFKLNISSSTVYAHIRYSTDGGAVWKETAQGGGATDAIALPESGAAEIIIQIIDDAAYSANIQAGKDGFSETEPAEYRLWVDKVSLSSPEILTAEVTHGDRYPQFRSGMYSYWIVTENSAQAPVLTYTVSEGSTVKIGTAVQTPDENGKYTLTLTTSQASIAVTSADGSFTNTYKFGYKKKSAFDVPDKVADYLCIGSQYTNASYGSNPEQTLSGSLKSLGNFGGYITYYYENPITDNPNNKYGMDFYVIGNSSETNIDSMAELGQVYVSEDGSTWYALAGSEHYEDKAVWDYTITYTKGDDGKAYWTDNYGNSIDYAAKSWPSPSVYYMNSAANDTGYSFTGIAFKSQLGNITGDSSSTASFASKASFGYADYYASNVSGTTLTDVNSYVQNPSKANGFDVAWAVDEYGVPVDVSEKEFHYIRVATASNIYAGAFGEKSTEVTYVIRTTPQDAPVGKTQAPSGVTISDGADSKTVSFTDGQSVYPVNLGDMKYVSVTVNGTAEDDNIYINNQRVASGEAAQGFKVTKENGETLVRVIVQNGDSEPVIYLLKLTGSASQSSGLVEGIKISADGAVRQASTTDGTAYTASVGYRIGSIAITPVAAQNVILTVNGEAVRDYYELGYGENTFEITAAYEDGSTETVMLTVTRESAPSSSGSGNITVYFTLYGDEKHGTSEVHTYKSDKSSLPVWISKKAYTVPAGSMVIDVFEQALTEAELSWENDGGNYISEIDGLAEFDNGTLSGWMYLLNGTHPILGIAEQKLKNGDSIIFHYTDDYTSEQGSEVIASSSSGGGGGISSSVCTVKFETNGGSAVSSQSINKNDTVTPPQAPEKDGYIFSGWYTDKELTNEYDFSAKVTSGFTLYAKWTAKTEADTDKTALFADVEKDSWYYDAVSYAVSNGLFMGVSETEFAPDAGMTRAMLVTVLYRLGDRSGSGESKFTDVTGGEWYYDAVVWAAENGIVSGISETEFAPDDVITREQTAAILYRYAQYDNRDVSIWEFTSINSYEDYDEISKYAIHALQWACGSEIIIGETYTTLNPHNPATRAQIAAILMRFCEER